MRKLLKRFLQRWLIDTAAVVAATVVPGITCDHWPRDLLFASLALGIVNAVVRPVLLLFTLPLVFFSMGLFIFVINALMLMLVGQLVPGFHVHGLWSALGAALIITLVSTVLNFVTGMDGPRAEIRRGRGPNARRDPPGGSGPIIDV